MKIIRPLVLILVSTLVTSSAVTQVMQQARYRLSDGDTISLDYRFTPEFNQTATVQRDGFVSLNLVGDLKLAGLTLTQAHDLIVARAALRLNAPELTLSLKASEVAGVSVLGAIVRPGQVPVSEHLTAEQAILLCGGVEGPAQSSQVIVFHKVEGGVFKSFELSSHKASQNGPGEDDLFLQSGDVVLVLRKRLNRVPSVIKAADLFWYLEAAQKT